MDGQIRNAAVASHRPYGRRVIGRRCCEGSFPLSEFPHDFRFSPASDDSSSRSAGSNLLVPIREKSLLPRASLGDCLDPGADASGGPGVWRKSWFLRRTHQWARSSRTTTERPGSAGFDDADIPGSAAALAFLSGPGLAVGDVRRAVRV